ncbi:MAG TPA: TatD family hydrolase [Vicinamibacterales bacterium]|nr:TatD family hydrolase [Vicinamibacterales bacterium]
MIDSHCHLADEAFAHDLTDVVGRAREAGLTSALCILAADDAEEASRAARVRSAWQDVHFASGVHPHQAGAFERRPADAAAAAARTIDAFDGCAVGEIGLDYHYDFSPRPVQREVFASQIALALERRLPVIIHTREATDDTFDVLREAGGDVRGVFHCFTGDTAMARRALAIGFYVSFAGIVTFPRAESLRDAARLVPDDRLLIETDSPYLAPVPHRGQRNEPAFVGRVLETLAEVRGAAPDALGSAVARNFDTLFRPNSGL